VVPMLLEGFASSPGGGRAQVFVLMNGRLYREPYSLHWADEAPQRPREGPAKRLYHAFALPSMVRGRLDGWQLGEQVKKIVQEHGIHLVNAFDFWSAYHVAPKAGVPLLFSNQFKGSFYREYLAPTFSHLRSRRWEVYYRGIEGGAIQRSKILIFPSSSAQELLIQDFPDLAQEIRSKTKIIYNGLPPMNLPLPEEGSLPRGKEAFVLNVANHVPDKGIEAALQVFGLLRAKAAPSLRFVNVGDPGPLTPSLKEHAKRLGLGECVEFLGRRPYEEVLSLLAKSILLVHTPQRVVFDLVVLEAMALGKLVVSSDAQGNLEALGEEYPFVIPSRAFLNCGEPGEARALESLCWWNKLLDPAERDRWEGYLKGRFSERFSLKRMIQDYLNLWSEVHQNSSDVTEQQPFRCSVGPSE
jgi:glycosyltransferase involved in cell wall biosynthesis